jgi:hypothetical protein
MPIGAPGWPEFAFWTASMDSARMALHKSLRVAISNLPIFKPGLIEKKAASGHSTRKQP